MKSPTPSRRGFLAASVAVPLITLGGPVPRRVRIAVKYRMIREDLSVGDKFKLLRDLGFDGVEVYASDRDELGRYESASRKTGLPVHGVVNSSDPDIASGVEMAARLGADSVLVLAKENPGRSYEDNFRDWQHLIQAALPVAESRRVRLCVENVRATFLKRAEQMADFIDSFESPYVRSYYDTGNTITWTEQSAEHWAKTLGGRIWKVDVKDRGHAIFGDAKLASKTAVGTDGGEVNWRAVRRELEAIRYRGWATAEVVGGDRDHLARMAKWMNQVLGNPT